MFGLLEQVRKYVGKLPQMGPEAERIPVTEVPRQVFPGLYSTTDKKKKTTPTRGATRALRQGSENPASLVDLNPKESQGYEKISAPETIDSAGSSWDVAIGVLSKIRSIKRNPRTLKWQTRRDPTSSKVEEIISTANSFYFSRSRDAYLQEQFESLDDRTRIALQRKVSAQDETSNYIRRALDKFQVTGRVQEQSIFERLYSLAQPFIRRQERTQNTYDHTEPATVHRLPKKPAVTRPRAAAAAALAGIGLTSLVTMGARSYASHEVKQPVAQYATEDPEDFEDLSAELEEIVDEVDSQSLDTTFNRALREAQAMQRGERIVDYSNELEHALASYN